jgi:hypothetical protein
VLSERVVVVPKKNAEASRMLLRFGWYWSLERKGDESEGDPCVWCKGSRRYVLASSPPELPYQELREATMRKASSLIEGDLQASRVE